MITETIKKQINNCLAKYPKDRKNAAVMAALKLVQADNGGYLTPQHIEAVADFLQMPSIAVAEVATFYEHYNHQPVGKYTLRICHNISCMLNGADELIEYLEQKLEVKTGEITKSGLINVKKVECLGACVGAPMMQIGDEYFENLNPKKLDEIINNLK